MGFLFSGLFWGLVIVLAGLSVILNVAFGLKIPFFRILFGLVLIYIGISLVIGTRVRVRTHNTTAFDESTMEVTKAGEYNVLFSRSVIDLTRVELKPGRNKVEVNTVFGSAVIKIDPATPMRLHASAAFAGAHMPDGNTLSFGDYNWQSDSLRDTIPFLDVEVSVVFGALEIQNR
jgi:hypothetical protein